MKKSRGSHLRCEFCAEEIESVPFQKDGMNFCSVECSDAMDSGESLPLGEDILDDPEELEDEDFESADDDEVVENEEFEEEEDERRYG